MSSPHEGLVDQQNTGIKQKSKANTSKSAPVTHAGHGRNEGVDPHWSYEPPPGALPLESIIESKDFEWSTIKHNEDLELWIIRVPDNIKAKDLAGLQIDRPASSLPAQVGNLTKKHIVHDVWCIGEDETHVVGGDELRGLSCLLPRRKKKGQLCIAPKAIAHHIIVSAPPVANPDNQPVVHQNSRRPSYPDAALEHHFIPYGARLGVGTANVDDVNDALLDAQKGGTNATCSEGQDGTQEREPKVKKRKGEGGSPRKPKKHKSK